MKKLSVCIIFLFNIIIANAQMIVTNIEPPKKIGRVRVIGLWFGQLELYPDGKFLLSYLNYGVGENPENQIQEWRSFALIAEDVDGLYELIIENFKKMPSENIKVELPNDILFIRYKKFLGIRYVTIYHAAAKNLADIGIMRPFRKKQISKLFGRKK